MKMQWNGKEIDGEVISFSPISEPWGEYHLEDGTILRYRGTIAKVVKIPGEKNGDGTQAYNIFTANNFAVDEEGKKS